MKKEYDSYMKINSVYSAKVNVLTGAQIFTNNRKHYLYQTYILTYT